jgi:MFS family permease
MGAGYLQTGYYFGFFIAAALNYTVGARFGWRAMFLCGLSPVLVSLVITLRVKEPARWKQRTDKGLDKRTGGGIFGPKYRKRTIVNAALLTVAIIGLWAGSVYEPTAIITLAKKAGMTMAQASKTASLGTVILSIGTILGCLAVPILAERFGRKKTLAIYFAGMCVFIFVTFGWVFYVVNGLKPFIACLFFLGFFGGNFALFSLWLPEQYDTSVRATAFSFATSFGRFVGAGVNFLIGAMVRNVGTIGKPVAYTAIAFGLGLLIIPFAQETRNEPLPD